MRGRGKAGEEGRTGSTIGNKRSKEERVEEEGPEREREEYDKLSTFYLNPNKCW